VEDSSNSSGFDLKVNRTTFVPMKGFAWVLIVCALALAGSQDGGSEPPVFRASVSRIAPEFRARMTSWHSGCPVTINALRLLSVTYWGFDGSIHRGRLIANMDAVAALIRALRTVFAAHFPIHRMEPVELYGSNDTRSMAADNTSAYNCRGVPGNSGWSEHAYGRAIDINPLENPEVRNGVVAPSAGGAFLDRSRWKKGMIHRGDVVVQAFARNGWGWGGSWHSLKDYQHFSATGR
jgi:D-alanyl-D-alanine carboxypeptidase